MRRTILLLAFPIILICTAGAQNAGANQTNEAVARALKLKTLLSTQARKNLSLAEQKFSADVSGKRTPSSIQLRSFAQSAVRGQFPRATNSQINTLTAILLSDWVTKERAKLHNLSSMDMQQANQDVQKAIEFIADTMKQLQDSAENIISNLKS